MHEIVLHAHPWLQPPASKMELTSRSLGVAIGVGIEMPAHLDPDSDSDPDPDGRKPVMHALFMRVGAPPAHGGLFRKVTRRAAG
jgi:hypothetical protein